MLVYDIDEDGNVEKKGTEKLCYLGGRSKSNDGGGGQV